LDPVAQLNEALAGRYTIDRELGRGGMATVYLAQDLKHDRPVAIKVLRPELAAALGPERFLREIQLAARLQHPHILGLHDSGDAGGQLWYAMPYVQGESLRDRLEREQQLPVDDAIRITQQVAAALGYAHTQNVIHRDIKPENILLAGSHAVVADFGIARALDAAGGPKLTETGLALGTPYYMSPEQAVGSGRLDGRADIYALGCVLYEMLAGTPPFTGLTAQAVLARHSVDTAPPLRTVRQTVPAAVEQAIANALAKVPADRFATAEQFSEALTRPRSAITREWGKPKVLRLGSPLLWSAVVVVLGLAGLGYIIFGRHPAGERDLIAIAPFRVSAAEATLGYLREGMLDLLAAKLNGEDTRTIETRSVTKAWSAASAGPGEDLDETQSLQLAERLGAGRLILGSVVGNPSYLTLHAQLLEVPNGRVRGQAVIEGAPDSLPQLVDRLAEQLLGLQAGIEHQRVTALTSTSLPAVRLYLEGQAAFRKGGWDEAQRYFRQALDLDSTFALAALALSNSVGTDGDERGARLAWTYRERLSPGDRALAEAQMEPPGSTMPDNVRRWEVAAAANPDRPQVWYHLGDVYFHCGIGIGLPDALARADSAFRRGAALSSIGDNQDNPEYPEAFDHMLALAVMNGDTARARSLMAVAAAADSTSVPLRHRWLLAQLVGDSATLDSLRRHPELAKERPDAWFTFSQWTGIGVTDAEQVIRYWVQRGDLPSELWHAMLLNAGRPGAALAGRKGAGFDDRPRAQERSRIAEFMFWGGDSVAASQAARILTPHADGPLEAGSGRMVQYSDICWLEQWRLYQGQTGTTSGAIQRLRAAGLPPFERCASLLDAWLAAVTGRSDAGPKLELLDSLARSRVENGVNLVAARLHERNGDLAGALAAVRRRSGWFMLWPAFMSTFLREEGRLAALTGDTAGAIKAYQHYLALRYDPEPAVKPEVDRVRAQLARLLAEPNPRARE
jgi:serine/threonine-protein kinase